MASLWSEWAYALWHTHLLVVVQLLLVRNVGWHERLGVAPLAAEWLWSREWHWGWSEVLVWVEASKSNNIGQARELDHWLWLDWAEMNWADGGAINVLLIILVFVVVAATGFVLSEILQLFWHWGKGHSSWEIWKWVDELSSFLVIVVEGAAISELTVALFGPVSARNGLVV